MRFPLLAAVLLALLPGRPRSAEGAEVYKRKCAPCHGLDGGGGSRNLTPLTAPEVQAKSDAQLFDSVARGVTSADNKRMPAFRGKLADGEIKAAIDHVRALRK